MLPWRPANLLIGCPLSEPVDQRADDIAVTNPKSGRTLFSPPIATRFLESKIAIREGLFAFLHLHFAAEVEGGPFWLSRNDVRIPNETGTEFSLVDVIGSGPYGAFRAEFDFDINERHGFRVVVAPLQAEGEGILDDSVFFAGETFAPGVPSEASYKFSSYRFTYRYRFFQGDRWRWKIGATAFVRDARIALQQAGVFAEDTDVGFVPLLHLDGEAKLSDRWRFILDFEGLGSTQGRAFDVAVKLGYTLADRWELACPRAEDAK